MREALAWGVALAVLGAILGSFIATLVLRWGSGRSAMRGRSACDSCATPILARDLVPVLSAIRLRARCRSCGGRIDPWHARIEVLSAAIGFAAGFAAAAPVAIAGAGFGWLLLTLALLDLRWWLLPDAVVGPMAVGGLVTGALGLGPALGDRLLGGVAGFGVLWAVARGYRLIRGHQGMGGGDPKLLGAIGLWLGWRMLPAVLLVACLVGLGAALVAAYRGASVTRHTAMPLGTLLAIAAYPAWLGMIILAS